jgi:hypothetical protein
MQGLQACALAGLFAAASSNVTAGAVTIANRPSRFSAARRSGDGPEILAPSSEA